MIREIRVERFKRFAATTINCAPLTVLTGANGAGKTSFVHALLLARLAATSRPDAAIQLNDGSALQLGEAAELVHRESGSDSFSICVVEGDSFRWEMQVPSSARALNVKLIARPTAYTGPLSRPSPSFQYLCAERWGPRDVLRASSVDLSELAVGVHGEYTAQVLVAFERTRVSPSRKAFSRPARLHYQVEAWMSELIRPIEIDARWIPETLVTSIRFKEPGMQAEWMRPSNMGFGLSYALPVVVAGLLAQAGGVLVVENPEAHLHPAAQSRMGAFLARIAGDGVQVFVETHSDHILNGIRKAVAVDRLIAPDQVAVQFFDDRGGDSHIVQLRINDLGQFASWPKGFFDQTPNDLAALARVRRAK